MLVVAAVWAGAAAGLALLLEVRGGFVASMLIVAGLAAVFSIASIVPVAMAGSKGRMATVIAYFAGASLRFIAALAIVLIAVLKGHDAVAVITGLSVYLPLLAVEAALSGRYLWLKDESMKSTNAMKEAQA